MIFKMFSGKFAFAYYLRFCYYFYQEEYVMSTYKNTFKDRKILDEVRDVMRLHHYSIHTERTYCDWIRRYIRYHNMTSRQDLIDGDKYLSI